MFFKNYQNLGKTTEMVTTFGGYCHRDVIGDGQFFEMENMSARKYPAITTRPKRQMLTMVNGEAVGNIAAMVDMDGLVWLGKDGSLHAGGHALENFYTYTEADRQMIPMGGYLIVWPDKVWANAVKLRMGQEMVWDEDYGDLEAHWQQADDPNTLPITESNGIWAYNCRSDGSRWDYIPSNWAQLEAWDETDGRLEGKTDAIILGDFPYPHYRKFRYMESGQPKEYWARDGWHFGYIVGKDSPKDPDDGAVMVNTSGVNPVLQKWFETTRMWSVQETLVRLDATKPFTGIKQNDAVNMTVPGYVFVETHLILSAQAQYYRKDAVQQDRENVVVAKLSEADGVHYMALKGKVMAGGEYYGSEHAQLVGLYLAEVVQTGLWGSTEEREAAWQMSNEALRAAVNAELLDKIKPVSFARTVPDMDFVIECGNRLWGCYYGQSEDGKILNEIYASKLGDFKNWRTYQGLSTDSYAASRGTDGPWTGAITMNNYPLFFKRNYLEKIYVSASGAHQIATTRLPGVQPGSHKSMQIVDGVLFYLSDSGVMVYDGSLPDLVSDDFGEAKYKNGVAGKRGYSYYLSVEAQDGTHSLFNLDTSKGVWHREDGTQLAQTADRGDVLYLLTADGRLMTTGDLAEADEAVEEEDFTWEIVSGPLGYQRAEQEYLLRIIPRLKLEPGASARLHVMYDDNGVWQRVACIEGNGTQSMTVPVKTRRCDHFRFKLSGIGGMTLYSITREIEKGSLEA